MRRFILFVVALAAIGTLLYLLLKSNGDGDLCQIQPKKASTVLKAVENGSDGSIWTQEPAFRLLADIKNYSQFFLLEPALLARTVGKEEMAELTWRFNLYPFRWSPHSVTLGMIANDSNNITSLANLASLKEVAQVKGPLPFSDHENGLPVLQHAFYHWTDKMNASTVRPKKVLYVHIVILHPVKHFFWVGKFSADTIFLLQSPFPFNFTHYGLYEQIFDPFELHTLADNVTVVPDDPGHLLSQLPTSHYLHCPPERGDAWLKQYELSINQHRIDLTEESVRAVKSMMRHLRMEFWIMCGTLLGWHRQCGPIPHTDDTDFSTWPKYLKDISPKELTDTLKAEAPKHCLRLYKRFGDNTTRSLEYTFLTEKKRDRVDLFLTYTDKGSFIMPFHVPTQHIYQYSIYPMYSLCSVELLGWKLLAPCTAEEVIIAEYGSNWTIPKIKYNYSTDPFNVGPRLTFPSNVTQYEKFEV